MRIILLFFLIPVFLACNNQSGSEYTIVNTRNGQVKGLRIKENGVVVFKGIPYAAPPIGDLRWKAPQPSASWQGVLDCSSFAPAAMQADPAPYRMWTEEFQPPAKKMSEDCLYLNIWTRANSSYAKLPVMFYIHGGAFINGSGAVPIYNGEAMAKQGIVFITLNYRLGIFGFLAHPELTAESPHNASGNYGLLDQVAALKWVSENIQAFGGDPENITIAGQSAGAYSVSYLVASPLTKGLFHKAIAQSGGAFFQTLNPDEKNTLNAAEQKGDSITRSLGFRHINELRNIPAAELQKQQVLLSPNIDGYFLPEPVYAIFHRGKQNDVAVLMGWNEDEGIFDGQAADADSFTRKAEHNFGKQAEQFLELFPATTDKEALASQKLLSSLKSFGLQSYAWINMQNTTGTKPVYMYYFVHPVPYGEGQQDYGAFHSGEISYAYGNLDASSVRLWKKADFKLEELMLSYWSTFAKKANPNFEGAPRWEPCTSPDYKTMLLGENPHLDTMPHIEQLRFLHHFYEERMNVKK